MSQLKQTSKGLYYHKILFNIHKRVRFGEAIYVCGNIPQLGLWNPERAFRLKCNEGDHWSGILLLTNVTFLHFQCKYIVADWELPSSQSCIWEKGKYNRRVDLKKTAKVILCDDRWNMDRVTFNLHVNKKNAGPQEERYYVVGDLQELGTYRQPKIMKRVNSRTTNPRKDSLIQAHNSTQQNNVEIYTFSFYIEKNKDIFNYYYIRKTQTMERERKPGRIFNFNAQLAPHPQRRSVTYSRSDIQINDDCSLNALKFSQITPKIYVGSYPKSLADIQKLKEEGITAIFSIQTEKDFRKHGLSPHYFKLLCEQSGVKFKRYSIEDMNNQDFVSKAQGGVRMMRQLIKEEKVYVHCTAGIYRSPQMIALYLILCEQYSVDKAIQVIKQNHPYAKPSSRVIKQSIGLMRSKVVKNMVSI